VSNIEHIDIDKDDWIYLYGSSRLQTARTQGYECKELYLKERLKSEYPGFKINERSKATRLDLPPVYAMKESLKWENAYIGNQIIDGECIAIDNYLGQYQIIKITRKPWYLFYKNVKEPWNIVWLVILTNLLLNIPNIYLLIVK
jgi:hypothetical protein